MEDRFYIEEEKGNYWILERLPGGYVDIASGPETDLLMSKSVCRMLNKTNRGQITKQVDNVVYMIFKDESVDIRNGK